MIQINKVEVSYFRSIYSSTISNLGDLSVLCGKNDTGKSNYLRALNLFFNGHTDWKKPLNFYEDFNIQRLQECRDSIKGKQFIRVKVHFIRGDRYQNSLPEKFWVSKTWSRDGGEPQTKNSLKPSNIKATTLDRAQASLQRYLNTIHYEYVPAVKDRTFFSHSLGRLQEAVMQSRSNDNIKNVVSQLNTAVIDEVNDLKEEFNSVAGVDIDISLPDNLSELFSAFSVSSRGSSLPFTARGDGIQARFLPSLLHHVSEQSKLQFIWGFEEPENCMEHELCTRLADDMENSYSHNAQIVVTSHSPAFIDLKSTTSKLYKITKGESGTENLAISDASLDHFADLGLIALQRKFQKEYEERIRTIEDTNSLLEETISQSNLPIVLVEGKTDKLILDEAWRRFYDGDPNYQIRSCSTTEDDGTAGCNILRKALESGRPDMPTTIGIFDNDKEGCEAFKKLDKNYEPHPEDERIKRHKNRRFYAILIPFNNDTRCYSDNLNLCIEFLFPEQALQTRYRGSGLSFQQKTRKVSVEGVKAEETPTTEPWHRKIVGGKTFFAERIVPRLASENFENFNPLLDLIDFILEEAETNQEDS